MANGDSRVAVLLPHGVLFRGNDEAKIRQGLLTDKKNKCDCWFAIELL